MKIAYLAPGTFNSGGVERILTNKVNYLTKYGYDITIITTDQMGASAFFELHPSVRHMDLGINFRSLRNSNIIKKSIFYFFKQLKYRRLLTNLLKAEKFDVVVSLFSAEVHWLPMIKDGSKKVAEIHFSKFFRLQQARKGLWALSDKYRSLLDEKAIKRYDKFIVLTNEDKAFWGDKTNIVVIHNVCHIEPKAIAKLDTQQVIAVGRLTYQKGYTFMIDAWKIVNKKHPNWILNIYGSGEDKSTLNEQVAQLDLTQKITIHAPIQLVENEIIESSMLLFSSRYEGFGLVLTEAMACGVPCVSFACKCGPRDIIDDGVDGFLVENGDIDQMADRICMLIENEELRREMGASAVQKVVSKFSQEIVMKQWVDLFELLMIAD